MKRFLLHLVLLIIVIYLPGCKQSGCTDPNSLNYDILADEDDGSCLYCDSLRTTLTTQTYFLKDTYFNSPHANQNVAKFEFEQRSDTFNFEQCGTNGCKILLKITSLVPETMDFEYSTSCSYPNQFFSSKQITIAGYATADMGRVALIATSNCRVLIPYAIIISLESVISYY